jgi:hypothetical protein
LASPETGRSLEVVPADLGLVGHRAGDRFLSAAADRPVTLNRAIAAGGNSSGRSRRAPTATAAAERFWDQPERRSEFILHCDDEFRIDGLPSQPLYIPPVDETTFRPPEGELSRVGFLVYSYRVAVRGAPTRFFPL